MNTTKFDEIFAKYNPSLAEPPVPPANPDVTGTSGNTGNTGATVGTVNNTTPASITQPVQAVPSVPPVPGESTDPANPGEADPNLEQATEPVDIDAELNSALAVFDKTNTAGEKAIEPEESREAILADPNLDPKVKEFLSTPGQQRVYENHRGLRNIQLSLQEDLGATPTPEVIREYALNGAAYEALKMAYHGTHGLQGVQQWVDYHFARNPEDGQYPLNAVNVVKAVVQKALSDDTYVGEILPDITQTFVKELPAVLKTRFEQFYKEQGGEVPESDLNTFNNTLHMLNVLLGMERPAEVAKPATVRTKKETPEEISLRERATAAENKLREIERANQQRTVTSQQQAIYASTIGVHLDNSIQAFNNIIPVPTDPEAVSMHKLCLQQFKTQIDTAVRGNAQAAQALNNIKNHWRTMTEAGRQHNSAVIANVIRQATADTLRTNAPRYRTMLGAFAPKTQQTGKTGVVSAPLTAGNNSGILPNSNGTQTGTNNGSQENKPANGQGTQTKTLEQRRMERFNAVAAKHGWQ